VAEPEGVLRQIWAQLPVRSKATRVTEDAAAQVPATESAEAAVDDAQRQADVEALERALADALARCTVQERLVVALRFSGGLSMTEIAELTGISTPTLHRRLANALRELRASLESAGVSPRHLSSLVGHDAFALSPLLHDELERLSGHVRLFKRDG
jgi:DNA-directed RNA polymerase specialized sigma24 family protein